jgi:hypothetical protein
MTDDVPALEGERPGLREELQLTLLPWQPWCTQCERKFHQHDAARAPLRHTYSVQEIASALLAVA